jgi:hypothetical protein
VQNRYQYVSDLAAKVAEKPELAKAIAEKPAEMIAFLSAEPLRSDVWVYRIVVGALAGVAVSAVLGAIALAFIAVEAPEILIALGSAAIGALAGLLAPAPPR